METATSFEKPTRHTAIRWLPCLVVLSVTATGCATKTATYKIRHRSLSFDASSLGRDYKEEIDYVRVRRQTLCAGQATTVNEECAARNRPDNPFDPILQYEIQQLNERCDNAEKERDTLCMRAGGGNQTSAYAPTGLALSGGGIRSASFSLGVLQALDELHLLSQVDYMSAVSGGAYMAGWVQAHLGGNQHDVYRDSLYYKVAAKDFSELLEPYGDNVEQLRTHAGFINKGGGWEVATAVNSWAWRVPFNFVIDVLAHVKVGINAFHPIAIYEDRIEHTYFRGEQPKGSSAPPKRALKLTEANYQPDTTPYLIINGNLVNMGPPRDGSGKCPLLRRTEPTTFSRYVSTPVAMLFWLFGYPRRTFDDTCNHYNFEFTRDFAGSDGLGYIPSEAFDRHVRNVDETKNEVTVDGNQDDGGPFPLAHAVAASGAAFDPDGYFGALSGEQWWSAFFGYAASPIDLNLGYETWNFARTYNGFLGTGWDYLRMLTWQRLWEPLTDARWIKITDGGHYENLGIASLVRRGTRCIIAVDAGADPKWQFDDLKILADRLTELGLTLKLTAATFDQARTRGHAKLAVTEACGGNNRPSPPCDSNKTISTILYLKPNANPVAMSNGDRVPHHLDTQRWRNDPDALDKISKIERYQDTQAETEFPHTSTLRQWYDWETFEAYRLLGFQMAKTYLPFNQQLDDCQFAAGE